MANLVSSWGNLIYMPLTVSAHRGFLEGTGTPLCAYAEGGSRRQGPRLSVGSGSFLRPGPLPLPGSSAR